MLKNENTLRWSGLAAAIGGPLWLLPWTGLLGDIGNSAGFLIALAGMLVVAFGLFGLYQTLNAKGRSRGNTLGFSLSLTGVVLIMASALGGLLTNVSLSDPGEMPILAFFLAAGAVFMIIGLAGMGLVAISERALGRLSFAPFLLSISLVGYIVTVGLTIAEPTFGPVNDILEIVTIAFWLLFGVALGTAKKPEADSALPA